MRPIGRRQAENPLIDLSSFARPPLQAAKVRNALGERQTVELIATIAAYNMVSRFLEATGIHGDD
jgi:alkylhydroperoxidase family enzyme